MKPGYKSTEFWMTMFVNLLVAFGIDVDPQTKGALISGVTAAYSVGRGIAKKVN